MTIGIRILPAAVDPSGVLGQFIARRNFQFTRPLQYPQAPLPLGTTGTTGAPGPGFIASASPQTFRSNINEDGTFPTAPTELQSNVENLIVHVSPTSGSTIIRGNNFIPSQAEFDPAYGLDVAFGKPVQLNESVFETAINDPIGGQFLANLQDLVARGILEVADDGTPLSPEEIRDFAA